MISNDQGRLFHDSLHISFDLYIVIMIVLDHCLDARLHSDARAFLQVRLDVGYLFSKVVLADVGLDLMQSHVDVFRHGVLFVHEFVNKLSLLLLSFGYDSLKLDHLNKVLLALIILSVPSPIRSFA